MKITKKDIGSYLILQNGLSYLMVMSISSEYVYYLTNVYNDCYSVFSLDDLKATRSVIKSKTILKGCVPW